VNADFELAEPVNQGPEAEAAEAAVAPGEPLTSAAPDQTSVSPNESASVSPNERTKAGRPRKHPSNAARQRAWDAANVVWKVRFSASQADYIDELAAQYQYTRQDVIASIVRWATTNRNFKTQGLPLATVRADRHNRKAARAAREAIEAVIEKGGA
jgi:hypothetical protein